jgi:hypothetical protein
MKARFDQECITGDVLLHIRITREEIDASLIKKAEFNEIRAFFDDLNDPKKLLVGMYRFLERIERRKFDGDHRIYQQRPDEFGSADNGSKEKEGPIGGKTGGDPEPINKDLQRFLDNRRRLLAPRL